MSDGVEDLSPASTAKRVLMLAGESAKASAAGHEMIVRRATTEMARLSVRLATAILAREPT